MSYSFPKTEKLCGKTRIETLYREGEKFVVWPLRITYAPCTDKNQILVWAAKANFKHAVDRNLLKRRLREAYRNNREVLQCDDKNWQIAINYIADTKLPYEKISHAMRKALHTIDTKEWT